MRGCEWSGTGVVTGARDLVGRGMSRASRKAPSTAVAAKLPTLCQPTKFSARRCKNGTRNGHHQCRRKNVTRANACDVSTKQIGTAGFDPIAERSDAEDADPADTVGRIGNPRQHVKSFSRHVRRRGLGGVDKLDNVDADNVVTAGPQMSRVSAAGPVLSLRFARTGPSRPIRIRRQRAHGSSCLSSRPSPRACRGRSSRRCGNRSSPRCGLSPSREPSRSSSARLPVARAWSGERRAMVWASISLPREAKERQRSARALKAAGPQPVRPQPAEQLPAASRRAPKRAAPRTEPATQAALRRWTPFR